MTDWERQKEATEFERVAKVHGPLTTALLSDRFTRAAELKVSCNDMCVCVSVYGAG